MLFFCLAALVFLGLGVPQLTFMVRRRRLLQRDWSDIVGSIEPVNVAGITEIAQMFLQPTSDQLRLEPPIMWEMLGGLKGLQVLRRNADAMLELCVVAQGWDAEGPVLSEMIRLDLHNLKKALLRVELATLYGLATIRSHFALMEIAAHYHLISRRLLGQYERTQIARVPELRHKLAA